MAFFLPTIRTFPSVRKSGDYILTDQETAHTFCRRKEADLVLMESVPPRGSGWVLTLSDQIIRYCAEDFLPPAAVALLFGRPF